MQLHLALNLLGQVVLTAGLAIPVFHPIPFPPFPWLGLDSIQYISAANLTQPKPVNGVIRLPSRRPKLKLSHRDVPRLPLLPGQFHPINLDIPSPDVQVVDPGDRISYPYISIGELIKRDDRGAVAGNCTGTVVGSSLVLTANHCVKNLPLGWTLDFAPGYDGTTPDLPAPLGIPVRVLQCYGLTQTNTPVVVDSSLGDERRDYVVCLLASTVGQDVGYLGTAIPINETVRKQMYLSRTWFSAGYPESVANGEVLVRADDITIESAAVSNTEGNETLTLPFAAHGWSGGPLYGVNSASGDAELIGVVSSFRTVSAQGTVVNSAVNSGGPMLAQLIAWARCRWPGDPSELVGC